MSRPSDSDAPNSCLTGWVPFRDIQQFAESFQGLWDLEYVQLGEPDDRGFCRYAKDDTGLLYEERFAASIGLRGGVAEGLFAIHLTDARGRAGRWQGGPAPESAFAYGDASKELELVIPRGAGNVVGVLPLEPTRERIERLLGQPLSRALPGGQLFRTVAPDRRARLESELRLLVRQPPAGGCLGIAIVESVVRALDGAENGSGSSLRAARRLFRRAMERCEDGDLGVSPAELALELDVSLRSLQLAFHACMGLPPARYLRRLRLNRAHQRLMEMEPGEGSVGQVAADLGFTQLGRFAGEYRRLFGEVPSETLRRAAPVRIQRLPKVR